MINYIGLCIPCCHLLSIKTNRGQACVVALILNTQQRKPDPISALHNAANEFLLVLCITTKMLKLF
ncbi:MAG: hypothetical protein P4M14_01065 [Gammaproteobacteria bacterium]|nr:hypothetical protein [Gammaproteobacteria bacterium]